MVNPTLVCPICWEMTLTSCHPVAFAKLSWRTCAARRVGGSAAAPRGDRRTSNVNRGLQREVVEAMVGSSPTTCRNRSSRLVCLARCVLVRVTLVYGRQARWPRRVRRSHIRVRTDPLAQHWQANQEPLPDRPPASRPAAERSTETRHGRRCGQQQKACGYVVDHGETTIRKESESGLQAGARNPRTRRPRAGRRSNRPSRSPHEAPSVDIERHVP